MPRSRSKPSRTAKPSDAHWKNCAPGRTLREFGRLSAAERELVDCCRSGALATVTEGLPSRRSAANRVRANLIRFLALGGDAAAAVHEFGVALSGAWITGVLSLDDAVLERKLSLLNCWIGKISASRATVPMLMLSGSHLRYGMEAGELRSSFGIWMDGVTTKGPVDLRGARVNGDFSAIKASFEIPKRHAFSLELGLAIIEGRVILERLTANATVSLDNCVIRGDLECQGAQLRSKAGVALLCSGMEVGHSIYLRDRFRAEGGVRMLGTRVGMTLDCSKSHFEAVKERALECERIRCAGPVFLMGSRFSGSVSFCTASITGPLMANRARFDCAERIALDGSSATIGFVQLTKAFVRGEINFVGAGDQRAIPL